MELIDTIRGSRQRSSLNHSPQNIPGFIMTRVENYNLTLFWVIQIGFLMVQFLDYLLPVGALT